MSARNPDRVHDCTAVAIAFGLLSVVGKVRAPRA
jgi:hypothetical protein